MKKICKRNKFKLIKQMFGIKTKRRKSEVKRKTNFSSSNFKRNK